MALHDAGALGAERLPGQHILVPPRVEGRTQRSTARIDCTARRAYLWDVLAGDNVTGYRPPIASIDRVSTVEDLPVLLVLCRDHNPRGRYGRCFASFSPWHLGKMVSTTTSRHKVAASASTSLHCSG